MIEVRDLTKEYPGKTAVDRVSFTIDRGETAGLLGVNGAGKSTIMNMITGYTAMTAGTVRVDGLDILEEPMAVRKKIGYLPELPPLYMDMTVEEYLSFVYDLKKSRTNRAEDIRQACRALDIADVQRRVIRHLSKGYRQRVGFAQALIGNPDILIFDEPTVGLDPKQIIEIRKVIRSLGKNHTIILSSHILSEVQSVCDRILVMDRGRLVADDRAENLSGRAGGAKKICLRVTGKAEEIRGTLLGVNGVTAVKAEGSREPGIADFTVTVQNDPAEGRTGGENGPGVENGSGPEKGKDPQHGRADGAVRMLMTKSLAEKGMYVVEMRSESMNLEDVFLKLTSGKGRKAAGSAPVAAEEKTVPGTADAKAEERK